VWNDDVKKCFKFNALFIIKKKKKNQSKEFSCVHHMLDYRLIFSQLSVFKQSKIIVLGMLLIFSTRNVVVFYGFVTDIDKSSAVN
jgi:hypothetical protein